LHDKYFQERLQREGKGGREKERRRWWQVVVEEEEVTAKHKGGRMLEGEGSRGMVEGW
jgi:hypothetical protein